MEFFNLLLLIIDITRSTLRTWTFISRSLKHEAVIFAEFLKHICERVNFSKVRALQLATLVTINTFISTFQGSCLIWTSSHCVKSVQIQIFFWSIFFHTHFVFHKQHFHKKRQTEIGKKSSKCQATHWGWTFAIWKLFTFFI